MPHARRTAVRLLVAAAAALPLAPRAARAQVSVLGATVREHAVGPGGVASGTLTIANGTAATQTARVYLTDYAFTAAGATSYDAPGTLPRSSAPWVALSEQRVVVPAGRTAALRYTMRVPADTALAGTYWSMLMVETAPADAPASRAGAVALQATLRYGVQLVAHLPRSGARGAEISPPRVVAAGAGPRAVEFDLRNTGERAYRPVLTLELFDDAGVSHGVFRASRGLLYPGTSLRQRFELRGAPAAARRAVILADTGDDQVFGADVSLGGP